MLSPLAWQQPSHRGARSNPGLLYRGGGGGGAVLLAALRAAHDPLQDERPSRADPDPDQDDWQDQGRSPGAISTPTPASPAPIAEGPITINRGCHSPDSDATASAAVVHASDDKATYTQRRVG